MRSSILVAAISASAAFAAPLLEKRVPAMDIDPVVLNFALTLEHLEAYFYKNGLSKYDAAAFEAAGYPDWVRNRVSEIAAHEADHVSFLSTALSAAGATPTEACTYSFPDTDPKSFLAVAQILEGVGVGAYLGAASLITNPAYLTAAATILTVEARHNAWIRSAVNKGDAFPAAYDTPLSVNETYSLASAFITGCPSSNPTLPVFAFPALTLGTTGTLKNGEEISLSYKGSESASGAFAIFLTAAGQVAVPYSGGKAKIPEGANGQLYVVITSANATITEGIVLAGPAVVEVDISPSYTF